MWTKMIEGLSQARQTFGMGCNLMTAHGWATHDCFNLELRHHQYAEHRFISGYFCI